MRTIGLVACSKNKVEATCPARELYSKSTLFQKALAYSEKTYDQVYILSAKHGLVDPFLRLQPYDESLNDMGAKKRKHWAFRVVNQMEERGLLSPGSHLHFHAGRLYRDELIKLIEESWTWVEISTPLEGLGIGQQLGWYTQREAA